jgi:replicative DNA helicase Mcm
MRGLINLESCKEIWNEFLKRYYWEQILQLACNYPECKGLGVEFGDLEKYNLDMVRELLDSPDTVLGHATESLKAMDLPADVEFTEVHVRIRHLPELTLIKDIRSVHINTLISVTGLVRKATEVRPRIVNAAFKCARCGDLTYLPQEEHFVEPFECDKDSCGRKGPFKLVRDESEFIDFQKIRIQDSPDEVRPGEQPQTLDAIVMEDLTGRISPGDRVVLVGVLRSYQRATQQGKSTAFDLLLDTVSFEIEEKGFEEIEVTKEDEYKIQELGKDPEIYGKIIGSIAPSIYGYEEVKEVMALQLFSGLPKELPDGLRIRGDIHVLLVGDPGVAKSQCLRYSRKLAPRGVFTSGRGSTSAGLTATAVKDNEFSNGRWTLEAGALVLADMGLACVDELDKMEADDRSSMHEAMEQQTVTINKAGINTMLWGRCAVLGAANPKFGRFDRYEPMGKQINLPPTLLSRFDLIFVIRDEPASLRDTAVSNHIFNTHIAGELSLKRKNVKNSGITEEQVTEAMSSIQPILDAELLRKYIAYAKRTVFPVVQPDARQKLTDFYLSLRMLGEDPNTPLPVTARQLEALIRLAEASARTRLSGEATMEDARWVIGIVTASLNQVIKDPDTGKLDSDIINSGMGKSQRDRIKLIRESIRTLQSPNGNDVPLDLILQTLEKEGLKNEYVEDAVSRLKSAGELVETSSIRYRTV